MSYDEYPIKAKSMHRNFHRSHSLQTIWGVRTDCGYRCRCGLRTYGDYPLDWSHDTALEIPCATTPKDRHEP